jgi:hypothetical protein
MARALRSAGARCAPRMGQRASRPAVVMTASHGRYLSDTLAA